MEGIPLVVCRLVAAEQSCNLVHYFPSFCDLSASPEVITVAELTEAAMVEAAAASPHHCYDTTKEDAYKVVYDVMRVRNGRILFLQSYAERFTHSLALAAPAHTFPTGLQQCLQARLQQYINAPGVLHDGVTEQNVKIVSWLLDGAAGTSPIPVLFLLPKSFYPAELMYREGAKLGFLYDAHRVNPNAKVAQTTLRDRANAYEKQNDLFEVLLVHDAADHFLVTEGSRSNYLLQRRDGTWWCSAEEDILVGITLKTTYRVIAACGLGTVQHGKLNMKDVLECQSLYMLGTSPTIMPVRSILLYKDDDTRRRFEEAVKELGVELAGPECNVIQPSSGDGGKAELCLLVDAQLASKLRAQYFAEAASS
ncbi:Amino-transferase class IV [Lotmaria passim]